VTAVVKSSSRAAFTVAAGVYHIVHEDHGLAVDSWGMMVGENSFGSGCRPMSVAVEEECRWCRCRALGLPLFFFFSGGRERAASTMPPCDAEGVLSVRSGPCRLVQWRESNASCRTFDGLIYRFGVVLAGVWPRGVPVLRSGVGPSSAKAHLVFNRGVGQSAPPRPQ